MKALANEEELDEEPPSYEDGRNELDFKPDVEETEITSTSHNPLKDLGAASRMLGALFEGAKVYGKAGVDYVGSVPGKVNS